MYTNTLKIFLIGLLAGIALMHWAPQYALSAVIVAAIVLVAMACARYGVFGKRRKRMPRRRVER